MSNHPIGRVAVRAGLAAAATAALLAIPGAALADACGGSGTTTDNPVTTPPPFGVVTPIVPGAPIEPTDPGDAFNADYTTKKPVHGKPGHTKSGHGGKAGHKRKTGHRGKGTDTTDTSGHKHKKHPTRKPVRDDGPASTTISVSAGKNQHADQPVTLTARVSVGRGHTHGVKAETGTITFVVDGQDGKSVPLKHGRASEKITLKEGQHTVTADYSGDTDHRPSESTPLTVTVS